MSSNKQKRDEEDDFFGSDNDDNGNGKIDYLSNKDSDRSIQKITPIGYSDGLEIGKEITLQRGFNEGFKQSSEISYKWSLLLGLVSSVDVFFHHNKQFSNGKDTSILGELVDKINKVIKDHCCSPTIDQLKQEFINFKDIVAETKINNNNNNNNHNNNNNNNNNQNINCNPIDCSKDDCCKKSKVNDNDDGCCGGNGSKVEREQENDNECSKDDCCKNQQQQQQEQHEQQEKDNGCCGGNNENEGSSCCNKNNTSTKKTEEFQFIIEKMGGQLFEELSKECVETISLFCLDGEKMLNDCLSKKFRVTIN